MSVSSAFLARLQTGATTTCLCWRLTRTDGAEVALTEHDRPLTVDGVTYTPGAALEAARFRTGSDLAPGHAAARGVLASDAITDADLAAGLWSGAEVDVIRADWQAPEYFVHVWSGRFSEIRHGPGGFTAELVSRKAALERLIGRLYLRRCDAVLGDSRCGVDLTDPEHAGKTCDQTQTTCREVFQNIENFRGFPHMPGTDFILSGPAANARDGGPR